MRIYLLLIPFLALSLACCQSVSSADESPEVQVVGAMKNVMRKGDLSDRVKLDTLLKAGFYGLGPLSQLTGEILVKNGTAYVSQVISDTSMHVRKDDQAAVPFLVYSFVQKWKETQLPAEIKHIDQLEHFLDSLSRDRDAPFAFRLTGHVEVALIHVQDLPLGSKVSSPQDAHQGQTDYRLEDQDCEILGFFSTQHQGVFTHHDSYLHMHLITTDKTMMGHLDAARFGKMTLFLPEVH